MATVTGDFTIEDGNYEQLKNILKNKKKIIEEINYRFAKEQYLRAKEIAENAVQDFYDDYPERKYKGGGLKNAYNIGIKNGEDFIFEMGPEFMSGYYHQGPEFVYENSFVRGWHGGSAGTNSKGVTVNTPHYKVPPAFVNWMRKKLPTQMETSPHDKIVEEWNQYIVSEYPQKQEEILMDVLSEYF